MNVRLVGITQPVEPGTANDLVAYAARVSNPTNQNNTATAPKLLKYLMEHQHWSPFEMVSLTMEIKTTRDISRQILRHRSFSFQEFSQRYAEATEFEDRECRLQDEKNRQNSIETDNQDILEWWDTVQRNVIWAANNRYTEALKKGIAKEQARALLPEGLTGTTLYMAGTLRSWIHYCQLRSAHGTQKEHMQIAQECWKIISEHFPDIS
jgi:thymidylate synthase (FAD)